eukprot:3390117-Alexandrium_andersonii.AAC.1
MPSSASSPSPAAGSGTRRRGQWATAATNRRAAAGASSGGQCPRERARKEAWWRSRDAAPAASPGARRTW